MAEISAETLSGRTLLITLFYMSSSTDANTEIFSEELSTTETDQMPSHVEIIRQYVLLSSNPFR